jgi:hypothetical protein
LQLNKLRKERSFASSPDTVPFIGMIARNAKSKQTLPQGNHLSRLQVPFDDTP